MNIFYSWQSDTNAKINRFFIQEALEKVTDNFHKKKILDIEIDQATREVPGSPNIHTTIFKKIDNCSIFVADISFINGKTAKKKITNQNVLIELGYAIKKLGYDKILLIFNQEYGKPETLPFDINHNRILPYRFNTTMEKQIVLKKFVSDLERAILLIDKKTMAKEKVAFCFYNKQDDMNLGPDITINGIVYQKLTKEKFREGINFNEIRTMDKDKFNAWQKYLYDIVKKEIERKMAFDALPKNQIYIEQTFVMNSFENKNFYEQYMYASLLRLDSCRVDFSVRNNNEQNMKNIKIVLKADTKTGIMRLTDFPAMPSDSIFPASDKTFIMPSDETSLFIKREQGNRLIYEYSKDYLYSEEEYILDEPLFIPLFGQDTISIEYSIFSENLQKIEGKMNIKKEKEIKILSPIDVFTKL